MTEPPSNLADFARDEFSQNGEDGILERLFDLLDVDEGWCVEFGAWDGVHLSNTRNLVVNHGWHAVLIEADPEKFVDLQMNARAMPKVTCLNQLVNFAPPDDLEGILRRTSVPTDLDLLSIDVDGNDYHIWESLRDFRPKVVVIEINPTIPNHVAFIQQKDMRVAHGSSLLAMVQLGARKGYELCAVTTSNAMLVREDLFHVLGVADNSPDALRQGHEHETSILHLFDGSLALAGRTRHPWNGIELQEARMQILPAPLRVYSPEASARVRRLQKLWAWLYRHRP
jgi:hypothetical protein